MTLTEEQIDWIVAEVIRRLVAANPATAEVAVVHAANHGSVDSTSKTDLKLTERLITLRTIEKQLSGVKRVVVPPKSVVTPAVKDELKARKIELVVRRG